jgi:peptide/nickel transport system permease protein
MVQRESSFTDVEKVTQPHVTEFQRLRRVFFSRKVVLFGMIVILILILVAIFAPLLAPYDPYDQHLNQLLLKPDSQHWLGTDTIGRDILSRIIYGSRNSLLVGIVALGIAATIGITIGLTAAYFGGWVYNILMRIVDALMCFPMILMALVIAALLGGGLTNVMFALGIALLPGYARIMSAQVLSVKENDYIMAEHASGAGNLLIMFRHIFPNCLPPLIVMITMQLGAAILAEAGLSFLGVGIQPPAAAWGSMVNDGRQYLISNPILSFAPGVAIMLVVFSFNMVGDGLRDALDPKLRGTI